MATACIAQVTFGFEPKAKPVVAAFDMAHASSDGGAVLLKSLDTQLQLTKRQDIVPMTRDYIAREEVRLRVLEGGCRPPLRLAGE